MTYGLSTVLAISSAGSRPAQYAPLMRIGGFAGELHGMDVAYVPFHDGHPVPAPAVPRRRGGEFSVDHIKKAMWLFPLYLFLINIFVLPIAYGGLLLGYIPSTADYFVLNIPLHHGSPLLALFVFIGGFSAATAMIIVESVALSTMVMNSFVMPTFWDLRAFKNFHAVMLNIKRLVILGCVFLGYTFAVYYRRISTASWTSGSSPSRRSRSLRPSILLGLYWKGGNKKGAIAGIIAGFGVWIYTLLIPALMRAGIIETGRPHGGDLQLKAPESDGALRPRRTRPLEPLPVLGTAAEHPFLRGGLDLHPAVRCRNPPGHHVRGFLFAAAVLTGPPARGYCRDRGHPGPVYRQTRGARSGGRFSQKERAGPGIDIRRVAPEAQGGGGADPVGRPRAVHQHPGVPGPDGADP